VRRRASHDDTWFGGLDGEEPSSLGGERQKGELEMTKSGGASLDASDASKSADDVDPAEESDTVPAGRDPMPWLMRRRAA